MVPWTNATLVWLWVLASPSLTELKAIAEVNPRKNYITILLKCQWNSDGWFLIWY